MDRDHPAIAVGGVLVTLVVGFWLAEVLLQRTADAGPLDLGFYAVKYGLLAMGLAQAYAGYWIHVKRLQLRGAVLGFAGTVGAAVVFWGPAQVVDQWAPVLVVAFVGAAIGAQLVVALHRLFVAAMGFVVGATLAAVFLTPGLEFADPVVLATGLVAAVVAGILHVVFVVVNTAVTGGGLVTLSLLLGGSGPPAFEVLLSGQIPRGPLFFGGFVAVTGVFVQLGRQYGTVGVPDAATADDGATDDGTDQDPQHEPFDDDREYRGIR